MEALDLDTTRARLLVLLSKAEDAVTNTHNLLSDPQVEAAYRSTLEQYRTAVWRLSAVGDLTMQVNGGALDVSRWYAVANATGWGLEQLVNDATGDSLRGLAQRLWTEVGVKTAQDAAAAAQAAWYEGVPVVLAVLVLLVALKVLR